MTNSNSIELIVLTHGTLAASLVQTAFKILGKQSGVTTLSSKDLGPVELFNSVETSVAHSVQKGNNVIIMVDLKGGNTWNIACKVAHEQDKVRVISGINLGMLLSYFTKAGNNSFDQLISSLVDDGSRHIDTFPKN